jgi:hypothetical protein
MNVNEVSMKMALLLLLVIPFGAAAQCVPPVSRVPIVFTENGAGIDTLYFGFAGNATYGIDSEICEVELPPVPPTGAFDARFVNIPSHIGQEPPAGLGQGTLQDYRHRHLDGTDTFRVAFQPGDGGYPFTLTWDIARVYAVCDSAVLQDEFGGFLIKARMHVVNAVHVTNPAISTLLLLVSSQLTEVVEPSSGAPIEFMLGQNYPNPFNPTTSIEFQISVSDVIRLSVTNLLGQEVAEIVSGYVSAGRYKSTFDSADLPSGVYLYSLSTPVGILRRKLMVVK